MIEVVSVLDHNFRICGAVMRVGHLSALTIDNDALASLVLGNSVPGGPEI